MYKSSGSVTGSELGMGAASHTASSSVSGALAGSAAVPGQDGVENTADKPGNRVVADGGSSISADLGRNLLQKASPKCRSQEGSRGDYGPDPAIKDHIKSNDRRGNKKRSSKSNLPLTTKLAGDEVVQGSGISNTQPSSTAIRAELCYEGADGDNGLPLGCCGNQRQPHDEVQLVPAQPLKGAQSSVTEQYLVGEKSIGGNRNNSAVYSDIIISETCQPSIGHAVASTLAKDKARVLKR